MQPANAVTRRLGKHPTARGDQNREPGMPGSQAAGPQTHGGRLYCSYILRYHLVPSSASVVASLTPLILARSTIINNEIETPRNSLEMNERTNEWTGASVVNGQALGR